MSVTSLSSRTPLHALESAKEEIDTLKAVVVVGLDNNNRVKTSWSNVKMSELVFMLKVLELDVNDYMRKKSVQDE